MCSPKLGCDSWVMSWEFETCFPTRQAASKSVCRPHLSTLSNRAQVSADFAVFLGMCKKLGERTHLTGVGRGHLGQAASKHCAHMNKNVGKGSAVWLAILSGTGTFLSLIPEVSHSRFVLWLHSQNSYENKLQWRAFFFFGSSSVFAC